MFCVTEMRPEGQELESHVGPHVAVAGQDLVALEVGQRLQLQCRLVEEGDAHVEERLPQLTLDVVFVDADAERHVDQTVRKLLK